MNWMLLEIIDSVVEWRTLGMSEESARRNATSAPKTWKQQRTSRSINSRLIALGAGSLMIRITDQEGTEAILVIVPHEVRAVLGRTSRPRSANHTTTPNRQLKPSGSRRSTLALWHRQHQAELNASSAVVSAGIPQAISVIVGIPRPPNSRRHVQVHSGHSVLRTGALLALGHITSGGITNSVIGFSRQPRDTS